MKRSVLNVLSSLAIIALAAPAMAAQSFTSSEGRELEATFYEGTGNDLVERAAATTDVHTIDICGDDAQQLSEAVLWMPDHDHGSAPTALARVANGCLRVTNVHFVMQGEWEIRYRFADGDRATQTLVIRR